VIVDFPGARPGNRQSQVQHFSASVTTKVVYKPFRVLYS
jgi:hypothetical protein